MNLKLKSDSPESTGKIAGCFGKLLKGSEVILIAGDLGAGKTLFTKSVATGLGIEPEEVVSPTFTIMNRYSGREVLYHFDLYRMGDQKGHILPELDEVIDEGVAVVEWAQYADSSYGTLENAVNIEIVIDETDFNKREIIIDTKLEYIIDGLKDAEAPGVPVG